MSAKRRGWHLHPGSDSGSGSSCDRVQQVFMERSTPLSPVCSPEVGTGLFAQNHLLHVLPCLPSELLTFLSLGNKIGKMQNQRKGVLQFLGAPKGRKLRGTVAVLVGTHDWSVPPEAGPPWGHGALVEMREGISSLSTGRPTRDLRAKPVPGQS